MEVGWNLDENWKQTGSGLELDWKLTGRNLKETGKKVVEMNNLSFQHHDVKDSSMKVSRFEKKTCKKSKLLNTFNKKVKELSIMYVLKNMHSITNVNINEPFLNTICK